MARTQPRPAATIQQTLRVHDTACPHCGKGTWSAYVSRRTVSTLAGVTALRVYVRCCRSDDCPRYGRPCRPEAEGRIALPQHEFGLDVVALVGALRYRQHRGVPEIHLDLVARGLVVCQRTATNLLDRYDELLAVRLGDSKRLRELLGGQGRARAGKGGSSWRSTACSRTWGTKSCGCCGTASRGKCCWPGAC